MGRVKHCQRSPFTIHIFPWWRRREGSPNLPLPFSPHPAPLPNCSHHPQQIVQTLTNGRTPETSNTPNHHSLQTGGGQLQTLPNPPSPSLTQPSSLPLPNFNLPNLPTHPHQTSNSTNALMYTKTRTHIQSTPPVARHPPWRLILEPLRDGSSQWMKVRGPMTAVMCVLFDASSRSTP